MSDFWALLVDDFVTCLELLEVSRVELIRKFVILKVVKLSAELFTRNPEFPTSQTETFVGLCNVELRGINITLAPLLRANPIIYCNE